MPGTYKCCVCQETGYSICSRMLSKRKPYRILLMAGLVLAEKMDISSARRLIDNDNVKSCKLCWNHSKDSLSALLSCHEHTEGLCNNEEDCSEIGEGRFVGKTAAVLSELDDDSIITSSVILKYISDEKKAIQDNDKKSSRSFQGAVKFVVNSAPEVSNVNDSIPATNHDVCEIDSVCSTRKRERKQNMSQVYHVDEDMGSGTETKTADPLFEEKNDCEKRRKDRRCGTLNCACCRFYQNEMKKMEEELCSLRRNQGSATDRSTDINKDLDHDGDPDYIPSEAPSETSMLSIASDDTPSEIVQKSTDPELLNKYFLVEGRRLLNLCTGCPKCGWSFGNGVHPVRLRNVGSAPILMIACPICWTQSRPEMRWEGQPRTNEDTGDRTFAGNIAFVSAAVTTGNRYTPLRRLCDQLGMAIMSRTTFYCHFQVVLKAIQAVYDRRNAIVIERVKLAYQARGETKWRICADGAYDSPGYCAITGKVVVADQVTNLVVVIETLHHSETDFKSGRMELLGLERAFRKLHAMGIEIGTITTDRCRAFGTVISMLNKELGTKAEQEFDGWHMSKWLGNKVREQSKYAQCKILFEWMDSLKTHLWTAIETGHGMGNGEYIRWMFNSSLHHVCGEHKWKSEPEFTGPLKRCSHAPIQGAREFDLVRGSKAFERLKTIVMTKRFQEDLPKANPVGTSICESKNALDRLYAPKNTNMPAHTYHYHAMLSTLHINELTMAELDGRRQVERSYQVKKKYKTKLSTSNHKTAVKHTWRDEIHTETKAIMRLQAEQRLEERRARRHANMKNVTSADEPEPEEDLSERDDSDDNSDDDMGTDVMNTIDRTLSRLNKMNPGLELDPQDDKRFRADNHALNFAYAVRNGYYSGKEEYRTYLRQMGVACESEEEESDGD